MSSERSGTISVVDTSTHQVIHTIQLTGEIVRPMGIAIAPDGSTIYVTTGRGRDVVAVNTTTNEVTGSVEVGVRPWGIAITPDGKNLYTANGPDNDVSVVDTATLQVVTKIKVGERPWGVVIVP